MAIINKITNVVKNFSNGSASEHISKAIGAVTLGSVLYDAHINGQEQSQVRDRLDSADRLENNYKQYITLERRSPTVANMKNILFDKQQTSSWNHIFSKSSGYLSGSLRTILGYLPEIGLSIIALKTKSYKTLGKIAGTLLGLNAAKTIFYDVFGIGK